MSASYALVADSMAIPASATLYTQPITMEGASAVQLSIVVQTLGGASSVTPTVEGSNDLVNWATIVAYSAISAAGFSAPTAQTGIAWQYVRLKLVAASGGTVILNAGISTAMV